MDNVDIKLVTFNKNSKDELRAVLYDISREDKFFNGEYGESYLWEEAKGFKSNQDYLVNKVINSSYKRAIGDFLYRWLGCKKTINEYQSRLVENGDIVSLAVAYTY